MSPSRTAASLRQIADRIDRSCNPSRSHVSAAIQSVLAAMDDVIEFTGAIHSRFDGENHGGTGTLLLDGKERNILFSGSSSERGTTYYLDKDLVDPDGPLQERLDIFFTDIWPPEEGSWDAKVVKNRISDPPMQIDDEEG